mmetsp:Transcript_27322/g.67397  ORF Transcript_27322/g.67397 Transcript_27322/m.67397 type:complete len:82 (+) Transcript_27322:87-332(+)
MSEGAERRADAAETLDVLFEMSNLLNTGMDKQSLAICVELLESGVNPEALAAVVKELRREAAALRQAESEAEAERQMGLRA